MSIVSLEDLNAQIQQLEAQRAQLQAEADKQRKEAMASVIQELIEKIAIYGITAKDLGLSVGKAGKAGKADKPQRARKSLGAKVAGTGKTYTGPDGQTWSEGTRGRKPAWLNQQLAEGGTSNDAEGE
jgi:DNA-binding protein H-NS